MPMLSRRCMPAAVRGRCGRFAAVGEADELEDLVDAGASAPRRRARRAGRRTARFSRRGQVGVDRELLGHVPDARLGRDRADVDRTAVDGHLAARRGRAGRRPSRSWWSCRRRSGRAGRRSRPRGSRTRRPGRPRWRRSACAGRGPRGRPGRRARGRCAVRSVPRRSVPRRRAGLTPVRRRRPAQRSCGSPGGCAGPADGARPHPHSARPNGPNRRSTRCQGRLRTFQISSTGQRRAHVVGGPVVASSSRPPGPAARGARGSRTRRHGTAGSSRQWREVELHRGLAVPGRAAHAELGAQEPVLERTRPGPTGEAR